MGQEKYKMSLEHFMPKGKEVLKKKKMGCIKRNRSQLEMAPPGQDWDNLSTKIKRVNSWSTGDFGSSKTILFF